MASIRKHPVSINIPMETKLQFYSVIPYSTEKLTIVSTTKWINPTVTTQNKNSRHSTSTICVKVRN